MTNWAEGNTSTGAQGPNLMVSRYGASENDRQRCAQCRYLNVYEEAPETIAWWCDQLVTPSGLPMPWCDENKSCGLFIERETA